MTPLPPSNIEKGSLPPQVQVASYQRLRRDVLISVMLPSIIILIEEKIIFKDLMIDEQNPTPLMRLS